MDTKELISHARRLISTVEKNGNSWGGMRGGYAQVCEFLRTYGGPKNSFLDTVKSIRLDEYGTGDASDIMVATLKSFIEYVESGLHEGISPERKAQLDVVSDFLDQAHSLLETKGIHPAAPAVLIGASLEEFLRTWVEAQGLSLSNRKPSLEAYSQVLREADLISKQDAKDITAWGGIRNHAAHGEWDEVKDKNRVTLMLEGVNLFMRKYST
jgi:hypothetical protein